MGGSYIRLQDISKPVNPSALDIYNQYNSEYGINYLMITETAIKGIDNFASTTPLQNSAAVSLSIAAID